jgi:hypothetical protein
MGFNEVDEHAAGAAGIAQLGTEHGKFVAVHYERLFSEIVDAKLPTGD